MKNSSNDASFTNPLCQGKFTINLNIWIPGGSVSWLFNPPLFGIGVLHCNVESMVLQGKL